MHTVPHFSQKGPSACSASKKTITSPDEHWLDNDANLVDEEHVLEGIRLQEGFSKTG